MDTERKSRYDVGPQWAEFPVITSVKGVGHYLPSNIVNNSRFDNRNLFKYGYDGKITDVKTIIGVLWLNRLCQQHRQ